ncbi:hypothetical protein J6590_092133 [Homalodisca vitripennis]|nr:hypothetical protein J6590_092133 [Homalodisca vitripennis]
MGSKSQTTSSDEAVMSSSQEYFTANRLRGRTEPPSVQKPLYIDTPSARPVGRPAG